MKNNYELIARNLTFIYDFLHESSPYNQMEEDKTYALAGILDALVYLEKGEIRLRHIDDCVKGAGFGRCLIGMQSTQIRNPFENPTRTKEDKLVDFVVNIEALLMVVDNKRIEPRQVIEAVISKRDTIKKTIGDTRALIKTKGFPTEVPTLVQKYASSPAYSDIREWVDNYHS